MHTRYAVALLLLLSLWCVTIAAPALPLVAQTDVRQRVIELTNQIRMANNLPPLKRNDNLQAAADWITQDNAGHNTLSHTDSLGRNIGQRFPAFGYTYSLVAENLAAGYATPESVSTVGWRATVIVLTSFGLICVRWAPATHIGQAQRISIFGHKRLAVARIPTRS